MTTSRILCKLDKIEPSKTFVFASMPCEKVAAVIREKTVNSMEKSDPGLVAFRYLQNKEAYIEARNIVAFEEFLTTTYITMLFKNQAFTLGYSNLLLMSAALGGFLHMLPNVNNQEVYKESTHACKDWLKQRFGIEKFKQLKNLSYTSKGIEKLKLFLQNEHIPTDPVQEVIARHKRFLK